MPRSAPFKIAAVGELFRQLRYAPARTRLRQMNAAEQLVDQIDPAINYPEDFVIFRITGYRPDRMAPKMLVGEALLPDLVNFVLLISKDLAIKPDHAGRQARRLDDVQRQLRVSSKSLQRYRKQGLVCHHVRFDEGPPRLACFDDALQRFITRREQHMARAGSFTRIDAEEADRLISEARLLRAAGNVSLNEAARQLAKKHDRAHETIRLMLQRHDREAADPVFQHRGPIAQRQAQVMYRAWRRGVPLADIARRFERTAPSIHRTVNRQRGEMLRRLNLEYVDLGTFDLDDAEQVILSHRAVTENLRDVLPGGDVLALVQAARQPVSIDEDDEHAMIAAWNYLKRRAGAAIDQLAAWPSAEGLDAIETDLRWAGMIKRRLVTLGFPAALMGIDQHLHRSLEKQPVELILSTIRAGIAVVANVTETINPRRGQRLARLSRHAMDRYLASSDIVAQQSRASAKHRDGSVSLRAPLAQITAWPWLEASLPADLQRLEPKLAGLLSARYGLDGTPPQTCRALATQHGRSVTSVARLLARAERELRASRR